jgi:maleamate amidohydrolase
MSRDDLTIYRAQGFGGTVGLGARPALCIVDFVNGFVDPEIFGGGNIAAAVANTVGLLAAARARRLPVAFSRVVYATDGSDDCAFIRKAPGLAARDASAPRWSTP